MKATKALEKTTIIQNISHSLRFNSLLRSRDIYIYIHQSINKHVLKNMAKSNKAD